MSAPNSPSRKSRFRAQDSGTHRSPSPVEDAPAEIDPDPVAYAAEEAPVEQAPAVDEGACATEGLPQESAEQPYAHEPVEYAAEPLPEGDPYYHAEPVAPSPYPVEDQLPAGLRLTRSSEAKSTRPRGVPVWLTAVMAAAVLVLGGVAGYFLHGDKPPARADAAGEKAKRDLTPVLPLPQAAIAEIDAAFEATKTGQFPEARQRFGALADKHPEWTSLRIEAARAALYEHDFEGAEHILAGILRVEPNVDAEFLTGLLQMTMQAYDKSEAAFARAVALDPSRPDIFYFWGECLRRQGKPQDAAEKFHEALVRNQYETSEGLYQLKLWLSQIQADREESSGSDAKIDEALKSDHPSGAALLAAAARDLKAGRVKEAGEHVGQAQKVVDPAVFKVILQDPFFVQESYRPELAPYYK